MYDPAVNNKVLNENRNEVRWVSFLFLRTSIKISLLRKRYVSPIFLDIYNLCDLVRKFLLRSHTKV